MTRGVWALRWAVLLALSLAILESCSGTEGNNFNEPRFSVNNGAIEGFVLDLATNPPTPVVGATVLTVPVGAVTSTGAGGFFKMEQVVGGTYEVKASRAVGQHASVKILVSPGSVARADINFNAVPQNIGRELFFITDTGTGGAIAHINADGIYLPGQFDRIDTPSIGGAFKSLKTSKSDTNELLVLSNFEHQENQAIFDVYLIKLSGFQGQVTRVTNNSNPKDSADLSPDGNQIVLSQDSDGNGRNEIWIISRDGLSSRQIIPDLDARTGAQFDHRGPSWSRESTAIAFTTRRTDLGALFTERDFDIQTAVIDETPVSPVPEPSSAPPRIPLVPLTRDTLNDFTPAWGDRDGVIYYSKGITNLRQIFEAPADDGGSPQTQLTNTLFENYAPVQSNDRRLIAFVSTDDLDGTNPDHSPEISTAIPVGGILTSLRHVTRTPPNPPFIYDSLAWRLR